MEKNELWQLVLEEIKANVTDATYNSFIKPIIIRELTENPLIAYLATTKEFVANVIKKRYLHLLEEGFKAVTGENYRVVIKTTTEYTEQPRPVIDNNRSKAFDYNIGFRKEKIFDPKYTFDNFVVGDSNKYAHAVAVAVSKNPSELYNPLFIYGKSGLGKTHLLNAIGIYILEHNQNIKVLYVSSETFTNEFIKALQEGKINEFKIKYREADVLLIDDIQFLEGKEGTQEEFFHTFNNLYSLNKQIIISGDRPPSKLTELDERLRSRFAWNMVAEIKPPDYETRVAILRKMAENINVEIDDDIYNIICLVSEKIKDNVRELEGSFRSIISLSQLTGEKADAAFAKSMLKDMFVSQDIITPEKIKSSVSKYYKIRISDLDSETRKNTVSYPRQIAMYLCRTMTDYSFPKIGTLFGNKHYSTVKHACDKIESEIKTNKELAAAIEHIKERIME